MAAAGILIEAVNAVKTQLTNLGLKPVTDPRNARPMTVLIELPTLDVFTYNVGDVRVPIKVLAGPPGNQDSGDYLMTMVDKIMNSSIAITLTPLSSTGPSSRSSQRQSMSFTVVHASP